MFLESILFFFSKILFFTGAFCEKNSFPKPLSAEDEKKYLVLAKNGDKNELANEICDLFYHLEVMMVSLGVNTEDIEKILNERSRKIGNLKTFHTSDHNT